MADDDGDKTEDPTPRRRQEARDEGKVARSKDLTAAAVVVSALVLLGICGPGLVGALQALAGTMLGADAIGSLEAARVSGELLGAAVLVGGALAPLLIGLVVIMILADVLQVGLVFNVKRLHPNPAAISPAKGLARLFGQGRSPVNGAIGLAKMLLVGFVACFAIRGRLPEIVAMQQLEFGQVVAVGASIVYVIGLRIGVALLVLALIDYAYQRYQMERGLRMTRHQVKDEMRRMDGDPQVRQRRRQIALHRMDERLTHDLPTADVILSDPTDLAIALKYDPSSMRAPRVLARGQGPSAVRIREVAIANGIPILEREPLARDLHNRAQRGQEIPEQFYAPVAETLAYVYELSSARRQAVSA